VSSGGATSVIHLRLMSWQCLSPGGRARVGLGGDHHGKGSHGYFDSWVFSYIGSNVV
jgi:hypothetical protein